ncbi:MAG: hypothetical protein HKN03_15170 [Acidimicrobiales bacterium]|nr:hypothetical protein [Acidimicrobiales bacterium]
MRHYRYYIEDLTLSGRTLDGVGGDLIVAEFEGRPELDWELVFRSQSSEKVEPAPFDLVMNGPEGELSGPAILVRSDGISHVFRGAGELKGFAGFI